MLLIKITWKFSLNNTFQYIGIVFLLIQQIPRVKDEREC